VADEGTEFLEHSVDGGALHTQTQSRTGVVQIATAQVPGLPEPGTLGLMLIGLAGLGLTRKRKQRQAAAV
jgi:hypothetical protein